MRRLLHLKVHLGAHRRLQRHSQLGLDVQITLVLLLVRPQPLNSVEQLRAGLVKVRIGHVDGGAVLAGADVLQAKDGRLVLNVKTRRVILAAVVSVVG